MTCLVTVTAQTTVEPTGSETVVAGRAHVSKAVRSHSGGSVEEAAFVSQRG